MTDERRASGTGWIPSGRAAGPGPACIGPRERIARGFRDAGLFTRWCGRSFIAGMKGGGKATQFPKFWMELFIALAALSLFFRDFRSAAMAIAFAAFFWFRKLYVAGAWRALAKEDFMRRRPPKIITIPE